VSLDDFKQYAYRHNLSEDVIGFLSYRPDLLHKPHPSDPNWPSPRTWEMASDLHKATMSVEPAVGQAVSLEFDAFVHLKRDLPDIAAILRGQGHAHISKDPSILYATIASLVSHIQQAKQAEHGFLWLIDNVDEEWVHCFATDLFPQ